MIFKRCQFGLVIVLLQLLSPRIFAVELIVHRLVDFSYFLAIIADEDMSANSMLPQVFWQNRRFSVSQKDKEILDELSKTGKNYEFNRENILEFVRIGFEAKSEAVLARKLQKWFSTNGTVIKTANLKSFLKTLTNVFPHLGAKPSAALSRTKEFKRFERAVGSLFRFSGWEAENKVRRIFLFPFDASMISEGELEFFCSNFGKDLGKKDLLIWEIPIFSGKNAELRQSYVFRRLIHVLADKLLNGNSQQFRFVSEGGNPWLKTLLPDALAENFSNSVVIPEMSDSRATASDEIKQLASEVRPLLEKYNQAGVEMDRRFFELSENAFLRAFPDYFFRPRLFFLEVNIKAAGFRNNLVVENRFFVALKKFQPRAVWIGERSSNRFTSEVVLVRQGTSPPVGWLPEDAGKRIPVLGGDATSFFMDFPVKLLDFHQCLIVVPENADLSKVIGKIFQARISSPILFL